MGCGGVDLLAYRATQADPLDLVRAARNALSGAKADRRRQRELRASRFTRLPNAGVDAFTIGSAVFDGSFSPAKGSLRGPDPRHPRGVRQGAQDGGMSAAGPSKARLRPQRERAAASAAGVGTSVERRARDPRTRSVNCCAANGVDPDGGRRSASRLSAVAIERSLAGGKRTSSRRLQLGTPHRRRQRCDDARSAGRAGRARARAAWPRSCRSSSTGNRMPIATTVERLRRACAHADALVAVGSGTINDLCKYAAAKDGKPYAVFATAPSMNGYTSKNAAITVDGHKKSLPAGAPRRRVHGPRRAVRGACADDPRRPRRFAVPLDGAGGLAAVASPARNAVPARAVRAAGRGRAGTCWTTPKRCCAAIPRRCARWRAR